MPNDRALKRLERALGRLGAPSGVDDRLAALRGLVEYWHGPILPGDGIPTEELGRTALPRPLLWWYRWAGRRQAIMSGQNFLYLPENLERPYLKLRMEDDRLLFYAENQGCYFWSTLTEGDDPPVFGRYSSSDPWEKEQVSLCEHLILACVHEAILHADFGASTAQMDESDLEAIVSHVPRLPIAPWRWCDMVFHAGEGAFMLAAPNSGPKGPRSFSVWLGAKNREALAFLQPFLSDNWDHVDL